MGVDKKQYRRNYYITHKEYFKLKNSSDAKKAYYRDYYQKNKHLNKYKKKYQTIIRYTNEPIIVYFN